MKLNVPDLRKAEGKFVSYNSALRLNIAGNEDDPMLKINLQAAYVPKMVLIKGNWEAEIEGECSRCLEKCRYLLTENFYEEFKQLNILGESSGKDNGIIAEEGEMFVFREIRSI